MSEAVKNNPKVGREKNYFVMTGLVPYAPTRLTTTDKKKPFVSFLLEQTREASGEYKEFKRYFQVLTFDENIVDFLTTLDHQVKVEISGNITIQAKQQGKYRVSFNKLIALKVEVIEDTNLPFRAKKTEAVANKTADEHEAFNRKPVKKPIVAEVVADDDLPF